MNRSQGNLQDAFLNSARRENIGVTIYLVSGVQLRGVIRAFDAFTVLLESQGRPPQMVYKHAIASVAPVRPVPLDGGAREESAETAVAETAVAETAVAETAVAETAGAPGAEGSATAEGGDFETADGVPTPEPAERELPVTP